MLTNAPVITMIPVVDLDRARNFYEKKLGLKVAADFPGGIRFSAGAGTAISLYQRPQTKADHTVANFEVDNVEAEVKALTAQGVQFEQYDMPQYGLKTNSLGISDAQGVIIAWFKDTEGNILSITQNR